MFRTRRALEHGFGALLLASPGHDDDWRAYITAIDDMNREAPLHLRPVLLQQILPGFPLPSPVVRRQVAQLRSRIRPDAINVVVLPSTVMRTIQVALDWLHKPHYESITVADLESGLAAVAARVARPIDELRTITQELRRGV